MTAIKQSIFRAYDIRGIVDEELSVDVVRLIGQALGTVAQQKGINTLITARDGRLSGPVLVQALQQGMMQSGCDVIDIGALPTPLLYFATCTLGSNTGAMLTGSHNPANYNGIKMVMDGQAVFGDDITHLYDLIVNDQLAQGQGQLINDDSVLEKYISRITGDVSLAKPVKVVVDCGNGIGGVAAPQLYRALGCEVVELFSEVDGNFPNHHPDPSVEKNLVDIIAAVKAEKADIGFAFDGDADRLGIVTPAGKVIWPDRQMVLFAKDVLSRCPGAEIVYDVKCSQHLPRMIEQYGGKPVMSPTGHSLIKSVLKKTGAPLAGEMSGHIFFKERWFGFDDGLYTGARLLEILTKDGRDADTIFAEVPDSVNTPELKIKIADDKKFAFMDALIKAADFDSAKIITIDGLRVEFEEGWGLVRPSNTTPCLVLRFEADNQADLEKIKTRFFELIHRVDAALILPA